MESETYDRFNLEAEIMNVWNIYMADVLDKVVDDSEKDLTFGNNLE